MSAKLLEDLEAFVAHCNKVNVIFDDRKNIHNTIHDMLKNLGKLIGGSFIKQTLDGKDTTFIEQLLVLVVGYQESLLEIGKLYAEIEPDYSLRHRPIANSPILILIDDLTLRLQTITTPAHRIATNVEQIVLEVQKYKAILFNYSQEVGVLDSHTKALNNSKNKLLSEMSSFDNKISNTMQALSQKIVEMILLSSVVVLALSIIVVVSLGLIILRLFRSMDSEIEERERAEKFLDSQNQLMSTLLDNIQVGVFMVEAPTGKPLLANTRATEILGRGIMEATDKSNIAKVYQAFKNETNEAYPEDEMPIVRGLYGENNSVDDMIVIQPDGRHVNLEVFGSPVKDIEGNVIASLATFSDITDRKRAEDIIRENEEKLGRSKKMEALGLLAGGVAHDLNNILSGIVSYPELLLLELPEESKLRKPIETIQESGHRAAAIVQDLLTVARGVATTKEPLNLNDLASDYFDSPEFQKLKQFYPSVTIKVNLDRDLLNISGSYVHIRKVVMNLVSNASEAIDGSGRVTVSTENRYIDSPLRGYDDVNVGEYVVLAVSDNGLGISSKDLNRIFEPFYTKKVMGRSGTGLGLAVVWNTVQDHNGYINVASDEKGSKFELYFPITRNEISDKDLSIPIENYKGSGETILVVDDEENQREISCKMLETLGYKAKAVASGEEAVEYVRKNAIDLLFLDMIMDPGINGCETYARIIKIHPNQKAVIASGYAETDDVRATQKLGAGRFIKKPLTLEKIGLAVKEEFEK